MKNFKKLDFNSCIGIHTLLYGETNTNKTLNTARFVEFLVNNKIDPTQISILDFAPKLTYFKHLKIGGRIQDYYKNSKICNNVVFSGEIIPPRLKAKNKKELYRNTCYNYKKTSEILIEFNQNPTKFLIINDISIYLHLGNKKYLLETIRKSKTFLGNSYYGISITRNFANLFSLIEKYKVEFLIKNIEKSYFTNEMT